MLELGDFHQLKPGDTIFYAGWVAGTSDLMISASRIAAIGSVLNDQTTVDFLEFVGVGKPGYSGGPVFNSDGRVIAIMREAWTKRDLKGGDAVLVNRGFSTNKLTDMIKDPPSEILGELNDQR